MYNPDKQGRDEKGRFAGTSSKFLSSARLLEKNLVKGKVTIDRLKRGRRGWFSTEKVMGGGSFDPFLKTISITRPHALTHELGHAIDRQLQDPRPAGRLEDYPPERPIGGWMFSETKKSGIPQALAKDVRRLRAADLKAIPEGSHIVSSPPEAFAHAFHTLRRPQDVNTAAIRRVLPHTIKATEALINREAHRISLSIGHR